MIHDSRQEMQQQGNRLTGFRHRKILLGNRGKGANPNFCEVDIGNQRCNIALLSATKQREYCVY